MCCTIGSKKIDFPDICSQANLSKVENADTKHEIHLSLKYTMTVYAIQIYNIRLVLRKF